MISIQPKWCELIANGQKTIEVRKTRPKIDTPFKCYIYETHAIYKPNGCKCLYRGNGKVIIEFVCDKIDEYNFHKGLTEFNDMGLPCKQYGSYFIFADDYKKMCLSYDEVKDYGKGKTLYGLHISDLKIYDKPKELNEFTPICKYEGKFCQNCLQYVEQFGGCCRIITRPPQSWCYVEEI
ncbi:MAG: ASCH domain-containing protein [Christensenellales bacterium]